MALTPHARKLIWGLHIPFLMYTITLKVGQTWPLPWISLWLTFNERLFQPPTKTLPVRVHRANRTCPPKAHTHTPRTRDYEIPCPISPESTSITYMQLFPKSFLSRVDHAASMDSSRPKRWPRGSGLCGCSVWNVHIGIYTYVWVRPPGGKRNEIAMYGPRAPICILAWDPPHFGNYVQLSSVSYVLPPGLCWFRILWQWY